MSDTPRTDAVERAHGLAWFGLYDEVGRYLDGMVKFREKAKELERDLAAANAKLAILSLSAQLAKYEVDNNYLQERLNYAHIQEEEHMKRFAEKEAECEGKQAKIDALMLEYCPDEMTSEQIANWARHQVAVPQEEQLAIDAAIAARDCVVYKPLPKEVRDGILTLLTK